MVSLLKSLVKSDLGKKLGSEALGYIPTLLEKGVSKIKIDKVRRVLNVDLANTAINHGSQYAKNRLQE